MDKTSLLNIAFSDQSQTLGDLAIEINNKIYKYRDNHSSDPDPDFIKGLYNEMPELSITDIIFIKRKLTSINKSLSVIKGIIVFFFVLSLLGLLIYIVSSVTSGV